MLELSAMGIVQEYQPSFKGEIPVKKFAMWLAPLALGLTACDGPAEEIGEEIDDVKEAQAEAMDETSDALDAMAENPEAAANVKAALDAAEDADPKALEAEADALEEKADGM
ncbi:MAG: hypothetical protein AAF291_00495 [Pseudomonadota bacterium]